MLYQRTQVRKIYASSGKFWLDPPTKLKTTRSLIQRVNLGMFPLKFPIFRLQFPRRLPADLFHLTNILIISVYLIKICSARCIEVFYVHTYDVFKLFINE